MTGSILSHYRIVGELGRGGMGIVYEAEDTKLDRTVAIKILPAAALSSEDDRARFYREAKAAAALNHPNIAGVHEIDEAVPMNEDGKPLSGPDDLRPFIAMEYIDGETLDARIKAGPMKIKDAVRIAIQIAGALGAAHEKDIVHRDIKAANVMLTSKGDAKVLDFGLALTAASTKLTRMGSTLGTINFMSPEQARGELVDQRSDLWSLGVVLYEMVTGRPPFGGDYEQAVVYSILNAEPEPLTGLRTGVPMELERIVNKLLAKNIELRYQNAAGLIADLKALELSGSGVSQISTASMPAVSAVGAIPGAPPTVGAGAMHTSRTGSAAGIPMWVWGVVAGALLLGLAGGWLLSPSDTGTAASTAVVKARLQLPDARSPLEASITPDETTLFYAATNPDRVVAYDLATGSTRNVERSTYARRPIVSPDGRWVMFYNVSSGQWWRAPVSAGVAAPLSGAETIRSLWAGFAADGRFVFSDSSWALKALASDGSTERLAVQDTTREGHGFVRMVRSPTGRFSLYNMLGQGFAPIEVVRLKGDEREVLLTSAFAHSITASGHLLTIQDPLTNVAPQTYATPIDLNSGEIEGATVALGARSMPAVVSPNGLSIYEELGDQSGQDRPSTLYRISENGSPQAEIVLPGVLAGEFAVSSTGDRVAVQSVPEPGAQADIFIVDLTRETVTRLTRDGGYDLPVWGPGDRTVYFDQQRSDGWVILRRNADGTGANVQILPDIPDIGDQAVSPDGRIMLFNDGPLNLYVHDFEMDSTRMLLDETEALYKPDISPDGRYAVFVRAGDAWCGSIEVMAVSGLGEPIQIVEDGCMPKWTHDGSAIYTERDGVISRTPVTTEPVFSQLGPSEVIYRGPSGFQTGTDGALYFDVDANETLWVAHPETGGGNREVYVITNWFEELNRLAPRDE